MTATVDRDLLAAVDAYVAAHPEQDRSAILTSSSIRWWSPCGGRSAITPPERQGASFQNLTAPSLSQPWVGCVTAPDRMSCPPPDAALRTNSRFRNYTESAKLISETADG